MNNAEDQVVGQLLDVADASILGLTASLTLWALLLAPFRWHQRCGDGYSAKVCDNIARRSQVKKIIVLD